MHMDNMKRVTEREQNYFYTQIHPRFTPYSLGIALPAKYGEYRVSGGLNPSQMDVSDHAAGNLTLFGRCATPSLS